MRILGHCHYGVSRRVLVGRLTDEAIAKVSGAVWEADRDKFMGMSESLLSVSPDAIGELTTIYVKFKVTDEIFGLVYAVAWIKNSKRWVVGLALPDDVKSRELGPTPPKHKYAGLTKFFTITPQNPIPVKLGEWAKLAYENVVAKENC